MWRIAQLQGDCGDRYILIFTVFTPWKFHSISGKTEAILSEAECGNLDKVSQSMESLVKIGSGYGLFSDGTGPLGELMLTKY